MTMTLVPVNALRQHEQILNENLMRVQRDLMRDGMIKDPIIVDLMPAGLGTGVDFRPRTNEALVLGHGFRKWYGLYPYIHNGIDPVAGQFAHQTGLQLFGHSSPCLTH